MTKAKKLLNIILEANNKKNVLSIFSPILGEPVEKKSDLGYTYLVWKNLDYKKAINKLIASGKFKQCRNPNYIETLDGKIVLKKKPLKKGQWFNIEVTK